MTSTSARGRFFTLYAVLGPLAHSCCPGEVPDMPSEGSYEIVYSSSSITFEISSIVVADDELTLTYVDEAGQSQWLTYRIEPR